MNRVIRGFTIVELMIILCIIAIIFMFAYPSYSGHTMKSRRAEGMGELIELADRMERYYSLNNTYNGSTLGPDAGHVYETTTEKGNYTLEITSATTTLFTITATPNGPQANDKCGTLTLTSRGQKSASGGNDCWKI